MNDNELIEVPGDAAVDLAGVWIYKEVPHAEVFAHEARGWERAPRGNGAIGPTIIMRIKVEEYFS